MDYGDEWNELGKLYRADPGVNAARTRLHCPELHPVDIVRAAQRRAELSPEQRRHLGGCAVCQSWDRAAWRSLAGGSPGRRAAAASTASAWTGGWTVGGGAALAAAVIVGLTLYLYHSSGERVLAGVLARSAAVPVCIPPLIDCAGALARLRAEVEQARRTRDAFVAGAQAHDALVAWQTLYNDLKDLGEWDDAVNEARAALAYCDDNPQGPASSWRWTCLHDLGEIHTARGDFRLAGDAFARSIELRQAGIDKAPPATQADARVQSLPVMYWRLANVALLEDDLERAGEALRASEELLRHHFRAVCEAAGVPARPRSARLFDAYRAMPAEFRAPPEPLTAELLRDAAARYGGPVPSLTGVMMLRGHLHHAARLARLRGDPDEAERLIGEARSMPYYPAADEYYVLFWEALEAARIAMAHRDFSRALREADEAARHTGAIVVLDGSGPSKAALGPERLSELDFLRGAALLGLNAEDEEGRRLVLRAVALPRAWEDRITDPQRRAALRKRFEAWYELVERVGGE